MANPKGKKNSPEATDLSPLELRFCDEYLIDLNGSAAYKRTKPGVTDGTARTEAAKLLAKPHIQDAIAAAKTHRSKRTQVTQDRIIKELALIAFLDPRRAYDDNGHLKAPKDLPASIARAITSVQVEHDFLRPEHERHPDAKPLGTVTKVKYQSKLRALEILLEHIQTQEQKKDDGPKSFVDLVKRAAAAKKGSGT